MLRYIRRHIVRAPSKSLLAAAVALLFTLTLAALQNTVITSRAEIDRLYDETIVNVEIRMEEDFQRGGSIAGDVVSTPIVQDIVERGIVRNMYLEASDTAFILSSLDMTDVFSIDILVGVDELGHLTEDAVGFLSRDDVLRMEVQFAPGFDESDFAHMEDVPIPIIISQEIAQIRNLEPGNDAYIVYYRRVRFRRGDWHYVPAVVLGVHHGGGLQTAVREGAVMPLDSMKFIFGDFTGFLTFRFEMDPAFNRDIENVREELYELLQWPHIRYYPRREQLAAVVWDQELRFGVAPLEHHIILMNLLFPITVAISVIIAAGFAMLTMLQNAKNAAIMRVLGMSKRKAKITLFFGQVVIYIGGVSVGLLAAAVIGLSMNLAAVVIPYIAGAIVGTVIGAVLVTNRAPIDLLQVKD